VAIIVYISEAMAQKRYRQKQFTIISKYIRLDNFSRGLCRITVPNKNRIVAKFHPVEHYLVNISK